MDTNDLIISFNFYLFDTFLFAPKDKSWFHLMKWKCFVCKTANQNFTQVRCALNVFRLLFSQMKLKLNVCLYVFLCFLYEFGLWCANACVRSFCLIWVTRTNEFNLCTQFAIYLCFFEIEADNRQTTTAAAVETIKNRTHMQRWQENSNSWNVLSWKDNVCCRFYSFHFFHFLRLFVCLFNSMCLHFCFSLWFSKV